jgi:Ca2+-binding EF-hand superfamily protein
MKKTTTRLAAAAFIGILSANSEAQTTTAPKKVFGSGELPEFLKAYDINADGKLSVEERQAYEKASREARPKLPNLKNRWDLDGDGKLSDAEKQAARDAISAKIKEERTKRFNELDKDKDGLLTKAELLSIPQITAEKVDAMVLHLDKTLPLDGQISLAEFTAALSPVEPSFPPLPPVPAPRVIAIPLLKPLDANKDGFVTALEFSALDADKDGKITPTEWKAYLMANPSLLPSAHPASLSN